MFAMPVAEGDIREGISDAMPIRLGEPVTIKKFDHLLTWYYR
jgi:hypothetical protein